MSVGSRRIDRALDEAAGIFKQTDPSSSKILVLLTSGRQAPESDVTPFDVAIQPLKDMGTRTYVIAIGNEPSTRELLPLVAKLEDVFRVLFDVMGREVPRVVDHIRKGTSIQVSCHSSVKADFSSGGLEEPNRVPYK